MRKEYLIGVIVVVLIVIAAGAYYYYTLPKPTEEETTAPPPTDVETLIIAMDTSDAVSMDPARAYEFSSCFVINQIYDKLVDFELPDLSTVKPEIAESWEYSENGTVWIFHIRHGIKFANGDPLTADAVVYSLRRVIQLGQTASWVLTQFVSSPDQIQKVDDYTVKIVLDKPVAPSFFLTTLTFTTTAIVNPNVVEAHAKNGDMGSEWMTDHSAGSGPFILEKWERESEIVLVANPNYWKEGLPKVKKIIVKHVPEPTDQLLLISKGDVDVATGLTPDQIAQLKGREDIKIVSTPRQHIVYLGMNVKVEPLGNEKVRLAIKYAIDYDGIIKMLKGSAMKWQTIIPYTVPGALNSTPFSKDVEKAKQLLAEAGYPNGFEITLTTPPVYPYADIASKIKADLEEIGIQVKIVQMTAAEMYEKYRKQGLEIVLAGWGCDYPDPDNNAKAFGDYRVHQLAWRNCWYDDHAADLAEAAGLEFDTKKRLEMYKELQEYILYHGPYAVLYQEVAQEAVRSWVKNYLPDPSFFLQDLSKVYKEIPSKASTGCILPLNYILSSLTVFIIANVALLYVAEYLRRASYHLVN